MNRSFGKLVGEHAIPLAAVAGAALLAWAWLQPLSQDGHAVILSLLGGFGLISLAAVAAQSAYLTRTVGRDLIEGYFDELDAAIIWVRVDPPVRGLPGFASGRDPRETITGTEAFVALAGATVIGVLGATACAGFAWSATLASALLSESDSTLAFVLKWAASALAVGFGTLILVIWPVWGAAHWLKSNRLIRRRDSESLRTLAAAASDNRTSRNR